jgi:hypothetical protein
MAPTNSGKEQTKPRKNVNVKLNVNENIRHKSLTLSDVETLMMENFEHAYVFKT